MVNRCNNRYIASISKKWRPGKLIIRNGAQKGFCHNFLSLVCDKDIRADFYAFCDQDDVWLPRKLKVALSAVLDNQMSQVPFLYCGRTRYVNEVLKPCRMSPLFVFPKTFRNAMVQSIAGGNITASQTVLVGFILD
jgi:hypothetical protein